MDAPTANLVGRYTLKCYCFDTTIMFSGDAFFSHKLDITKNMLLTLPP